MCSKVEESKNLLFDPGSFDGIAPLKPMNPSGFPSCVISFSTASCQRRWSVSDNVGNGSPSSDTRITEEVDRRSGEKEDCKEGVVVFCARFLGDDVRS